MNFFLFLMILVSSVLFSSQQNVTNEINEILGEPLDALLTRLTELFEDIDKVKGTTATPSICKQCEQVVGNLISLRKSGANRTSIKEYLARLCVSILGYRPSVCRVFSEIETDVILYIIDNKDVSPSRVCGIYFQFKGCIDPDAKKWIIDIPPKKQTISKIKKLLRQNSLKIVHFTDVHYDPLYRTGFNAKCDMPLCCEEVNGCPADTNNRAGMFGDYRSCDMPKNSLINLLTEIKNTQQHIDYVYFTGDIVAHKNWETSKKSNLDTIKEFYDYLHDYFGNTTVYPVLGNHEAHPCNLYAPLNVSSQGDVGTQWLFDAVANYWARWLPSSALDTVRLGGYYTVRVYPGFRIIVLNSNVCFTENFWLIYDDEDPYDQLKWLVKTLLEAEKKNEKVHILSHIPPGEPKCHRQWQYNFNRIVYRFSDTIKAHFNGHTHDDEFRIYKNESDSNQAINVAFNGGSFTTFVGLNPNYRVYDVDSQNLMVVDYQQYTFNMSLANARWQIEWYKLYSFKSTYELENMEYESLLSLTERFESDPKLAQQYVWYFVRGSEHAFENGCNETCVKSKICHISAVDADSSIKCGDYS